MNKLLTSESDKKLWNKHLENIRILSSIGRKPLMNNLERAKAKQSSQQNYLKIIKLR